MGTESSLTGSIEITPVPRETDFDRAKLTQNKAVGWGYECINVEFDTETDVQTENDGDVLVEVRRTRVTGARINSCNTGGHKHYHTVPTLQAIVDMLGKDREYKGFFEMIDEYGEMNRYGIVNGIVREYTPKIVWPEEVS